VRTPVLLAVTALVGATAAAVSAATPASAATPGGTYVALARQSRVVDTRTGAAGNHRGAVRGGHGISAAIAGRGGVPSSGVASVVVTITALSPTAGGGIVGYVGARPSTTNVQFAKGHAATDTAILPLSSGRVSLFNTATSGSVQIVVDVSGYYRSGTPSGTDPGVFHSVRPARVVNTVTGGGYGNRRGAVPAGRAFTASLAHAGVPADAGAVAVTITALNVRRPGAVVARRPDEPQPSLAVLHLLPGRRTSAFAAVRVRSGRVALVNSSAASVDLLVDVLGYYNTGFAGSACAFQTLGPTRISTTTVPAHTTSRVAVAGRGGVPLSGAAAVLATLHVSSPKRSGDLQAWRTGRTRPSSTTVLHFQAGATTSNQALVPVSRGTFTVHNTSAAAVRLVVDIDGFVPATALALPSPRSTARYVRNINGTSGDVTTMGNEGAADAAVGYSFVLLDIGAQLNNKTGVELTGGIDIQLSYAQLVTALNAYVSAFAAAGGTGMIAIGSNNDATNWTAYTAAQRGRDWATKVITQITAHAGLTIAGADDIEPGFFSTERQAEAWETAFLGAGSSLRLVFNGSADGCPTTWTTGATCAYGWTAKQLYALATGVGHASRTTALPQVFHGAMATQWAMIDKTGGGGIRFAGSLTEYALDHGTLTPTQGWTALRRAVSSVTATSIGPAVADIHT
jgi:hypothetical protein